MADTTDDSQQSMNPSPVQPTVLTNTPGQGSQSNNAAHAVLRPIDRESYPLSIAQQRVWFLHHLEPENPVYNQSFALRLRGPLNLVTLEQTLNEIVRRHEILRASFPSVDDQPVQQVASERRLTLQATSVEGTSLTDRENRARQMATEEVQQPFDLTRGALIRPYLFQLGDQDHVLLLVTHQIVADAWSVQPLVREMAALYQAFSAGNSWRLPELSLQYADYARWQRDWLQGKALASEVEFWKTQLDGQLPLLYLPTDHPRPSTQTFRGATYSFTFSPSLSSALVDTSRQEGATLFVTLLTAFQVLMHRYTDQDDIIVGSHISGRNGIETEELIGPLANTLAIRADLSGNPTWRELLEQVKKKYLDVCAHAEFPFEKLLEEFQLGRDLSHSPVFQVMFNLEDGDESSIETPYLRIENFEIDSPVALLDLTLNVIETDAGLSCRFVYNPDLFDAATIHRMVGHFQTLMESIVSNPEQRIDVLPMLTEAERRQLLIEWNGAPIDYSRDRCVHQLFEEQAERTPDAVAVILEGQRLTYAELNRRANQVARYLQRLGVGPEDLVGICVGRTMEMVVGILGILKAGGAYVPLDPAYPQERLTFMLEDAQISILLTQAELAANFSQHRLQIVRLDAEWADISRERDENLPSSASAENLAYVIYTSGSTGKPKGVMITHANLCHFVQAVRRSLDVTDRDICLHTASMTYALSVRQLMTPLCVGATLVVATEAQVGSPVLLFDLIKQQHVTEMDFVPAYWRFCVQVLGEMNPQSRTELLNNDLCQIVSIGESLLSDIPRAWTREFQHPARLVNIFGQSESTGVVAAYPIPDAYDDRIQVVPIGRCIVNTQMYLLDSGLEPVPIGVPGEICISSPSIGRGYFHRPDLTAEKFIPNPFAEEPGARLYRTGDLARRSSNGNIEMLGRIDNQVKLSGIRVELGEIESVLREHPAVRESVVLVREKSPGDKHLFAYIVPAPGKKTTRGELRQALKERLPEYMVPSAFVFLDRLPLTPNGKVDRRALLASDALPESDGPFAEPRTPIEEQLAEIWVDLLGVERVGIYDDFFALGGNSLLAIRLFTQIEKVWSKKLPLATIFQSPTLEQVAEAIRQGNASGAASTVVPIQANGSRPPLLCVHALDGHPLRYHALAQHLGPDQPLYALQSPGMNGEQLLFNSIEEMAARYVRDIRAMQPNGPYLLIGLSMGGLVAFEIAQQLDAQGQQVGLLALLDTNVIQSPRYFEALSRAGRFRCQMRKWNTRIRFHIKSLLTLPPQQKAEYARQWFRRRIEGDVEQQELDLRQAEIISGLPEYMQEIIAANRAALHQYVPRAYRGKVLLFKAKRKGEGLYYGWEELAKGGVETYVVPGDHVGILEEPNVQVLATQLKASLIQLAVA